MESEIIVRKNMTLTNEKVKNIIMKIPCLL